MPRSAAGMASIQGNIMRITPLTETGAIDTSKPVHWTKGFISASFTPEFEDGEETNIKAADGSICVSWKTNDAFKRLSFNLSLCGVDPEVSKLLAGGELLVGASSGGPASGPSGDTGIVGYSFMPKILDNPVAIEIWATAVKDGQPNGFWHWAFPLVKIRYTGDREFSSGVLSNEFTGQASGNETLSAQGLNDALYPSNGNDKLEFPSVADFSIPEEESYSLAHYAKALANPFSYVLADKTRAPAFVDSFGDECKACTGSWLPSVLRNHGFEPWPASDVIFEGGTAWP